MSLVGLLGTAAGIAAVILLALWQSALRRNKTLLQRLEAPTAEVPPPPAAETGLTPAGLFSLVGDRVHEVVVLHTTGILYANPQFAELLGVDRMDLVGRSLAEFVPADEMELMVFPSEGL